MTIGFKTGASFEQSWLQGEVKITYAELVEAFGPENCEGDGYKVQAEWSIKFADGIYATIYDWKEGVNYCGPEDGIPKEQVTNWHIGGTTKGSVTHVMEVIKSHREAKLGRTFEQAMAQSKPLAEAKQKVLNVDMYAFRNALSDAQNRAVDITEAIQKRDGSVPRDKLIEYTVAGAEARILSTIIKTLDACSQ